MSSQAERSVTTSSAVGGRVTVRSVSPGGLGDGLICN